jgi:hypothetical protein
LCGAGVLFRWAIAQTAKKFKGDTAVFGSERRSLEVLLRSKRLIGLETIDSRNNL